MILGKMINDKNLPSVGTSLNGEYNEVKKKKIKQSWNKKTWNNFKNETE